MPTAEKVLHQHLITIDGNVATSLTTISALTSAYLSDQVAGPIEYVAVLFDGKPATMVVNEVGASVDTTINPDGQLPANARATAIYWTATIKGVTGIPFDALQGPMIHGDVVLLEIDKRQL